VRLTLASVLLEGLSFALFFFRIDSLPIRQIDENYYVPAARAFLGGTADDTLQHPPLGKIIIAVGIRVLGDRPEGWRLASAVFGSITLVAIFIWAYMLTQDFGLALFAAILTIFNNFLYVMARIAMLDVFYFTFVLLGILAFTRAILTTDLSLFRRRVFVFVAGLMFGAAISCKWTGIVFQACLLLLLLYLRISDSHKVRELGLATLVLGLGVVPLATYYTVFGLASMALHLPFSLHEFVAQNVSMWKWHRAVPGNPTLNVRWYQWFFRSSPERAFSYLVGNFVVMWTGVGAVILCAWNWWKNRTLAVAEAMLVLLYSANVLQWVVIPQRVTCYYYYYPSAMLLGVAIALAIGRAGRPSWAGVRVSLVLMIATFLFFLFSYPHMAGLQAPFDCALGCWP